MQGFAGSEIYDTIIINTMKLSDYLVEYLVERGAMHAFIVIGGACAHIVDSIGKNKDIKYVCFQHEQAAAMAADAYSRVTKNVGVAVATSGPGATNFITGICCSWFDSIPTLFITGQVNLHETKMGRKARQIGFQETDIVEIVHPITKFAHMVTEPEKIKYYLDKAFYLAKSGRPGPVLLDIPTNLQHADIEPSSLKGFSPKKQRGSENLSKRIQKEVIGLLKSAKRPVVIAGVGVKLAGAEDKFRRVVEQTGFPVVSSWSGLDILWHDHPLYFGQIGVYGNRGSNFLVQNSDLILAIGSRLDSRQISGQPHTFGRAAKKIVVDVDIHELNKDLTKIDVPIREDAGVFLDSLFRELADFDNQDLSGWLGKCDEWRNNYPAVLPEYFEQKENVNPYVFMRVLSEELEKDDIIIPDIGAVLVWAAQALRLKRGQKFFTAFGHAPMGYSLPGAIGAYFADNSKRIISLNGDGGLQLNIQELQTVKYHNIPLKIFVINNNAYGIIKQFQEIYFNNTYHGTNRDSGYSAPDFVSVAQAYGIPAVRISNHEGLREKIREVIEMDGPVVCDVTVDESQKLIPKLVADRTLDGKYISKPLEDMAPFLPREEFMKNMIIEPLPESNPKTNSSEIN